jgi:hypothetical protein
MLSIPPLIILLYFLKLRRSPKVVPSTYLWRKTIEDMQVNSLWQRLRKSLLLLLQLLFILFLIIACLRPGFRTEGQSGSRVIYLLDNSASMQATDVAPSRFAEAKKKIREEIDSMAEDDVAMLVAFSNRADVRQGFTSDRSRLLAALDATEVSNRTSNVAEALRAAAGLANPGRSSFGDVTDVQVADAVPADVRVFSDGRFPSVNDFSMGNLKPTYIPIGNPNSSNLGVVAFSIDHNSEDVNVAQAYARVLNSSPMSQTVTLRFKQDGDMVDAAELNLPPDETRGVSFEIQNPSSSAVYEVELDTKDVLQIDNTASTTLRPDRKIEVLVVGDGSKALETVFAAPTVAESANTNYIDATTYQKWADEGFTVSTDTNSVFSTPLDLIVFDNVEVTKLPPANTFFFGGSVPTDSAWKYGENSGPIIIVDWDRSHPIMQFLTLGSLRIVQGRSVEGPETAQVLMRGDNGPLFSIAPRGAFQDAVLGFGLRSMIEGQISTNTDWPIKPSFPVFILAMLENVGGATKQRSNLSIRPGEPAILTVPPRLNSFIVSGPSGTSTRIDRDSAGQLVWTDTDRLGVYRLTSADNVTQPLDAFVVNLLSADESQIATASAVQFGYEDVKATASTTPKRREFWRWVLLLGLILLVAEWAVFTKRIFVYQPS